MFARSTAFNSISTPSMNFSGSLAVVGIGIRSPGHTTLEAVSRIESADKVFCLVPSPLAEYWLRGLNAETESLSSLYAVGKKRSETYREVVDRITSAVRTGQRVCAVSYGHPGVAADPFHESIRQLRAEGFSAEMLPAVSSEDALFADLGVDPINRGCLSYEATDFVLCRRSMDPAANLILWQIGVICEWGYKPQTTAWNQDGLVVLTERLLEVYPPDHQVVIYEAASVVPCEPSIDRVALQGLPNARVSVISTLFVPPTARARIHEPTARRLSIELRCRASGAPLS